MLSAILDLRCRRHPSRGLISPSLDWFSGSFAKRALQVLPASNLAHPLQLLSDLEARRANDVDNETLAGESDS